jgi:3-methylfumaryl-CoA hydratase
MIKPDLSQWVGRTERTSGIFDASMAGKLSATIGGPAADTGEVMPYLAHWCAFPTQTSTPELSENGHPKLGDFLPPVQLSRRMWAGGSLEFHGPMHVGAQLSRHSKIAAVAEKQGVAGPMVFVTLEHDLYEDNRLAVRETHDSVYLDIPKTFSPPSPKPTPSNPDMIGRVEMSEALLFRFSAVTFNAHRIHYDLPYTQTVEKYPGLVVHGPLQAMLMMQAAARFAKQEPQFFRYRGIHPMFHFDDLHVFGQRTEGGVDLCTGVVGGHQGMQASIVWKDPT